MDSIGSGQLVDGNDRAGLAIQATLQAVVLSTQLDSGYVPDSNSRPIRCFAHHDITELFRRSQAALSQHRIGELLIALGRLATDLARRIDGILSPEGVGNIGDRDAKLCHLIRLHP